MGKVIISTNTDKKKVQEVALGIEEIYRSGIRYRISEFILAFGGGINQTPGKDSGFIIPGPYIDIEIFENAFSLPSLPLTMVYVWYKDEDVKMDDVQAAWDKTLIKELKKKIEEQKSLIDDLVEYNKELKDEKYKLIYEQRHLKEKNMKEDEGSEKKIEELRCLIDDLVECNKKLEDEKRMLLQERRQLTAKIMKLDEKAAKEKENDEFEKDYIKNLEEANDRLRKAIERQDTKIQCLKDDAATSSEKHNIEIQNAWKTIESKEKSIQALMDQLDARDREIEKYKFMAVHMADDLYGKGDLDRGEEDLEDDCCET